MEKLILVDAGLSASELTVRKLAELFCGLRSDEQAEWFNRVAEVAAGWTPVGDTYPLEKQMCFVRQDPSLNAGGREVMDIIGGNS